MGTNLALGECRTEGKKNKEGEIVGERESKKNNEKERKRSGAESARQGEEPAEV